MSELYAYQQVDVDWLIARRAGIVADEMGLGKTIIAIVAMARIGATRGLVIAPAIAFDMWSREFGIWYPERTVQIVRSGADAKGLWGDVIICSYSLLHRILDALRRRYFDVIVCDEAQNLKSIDSLRSKAVYGKAGLITRSRRFWLLSGTIAPNGPHELWTHYHALFRGPLSYEAFIRRYCRVRETRFGQQVIGANLATAPELAAIMAPHIIRHRQVDVLSDMPSLRVSHFPVAPASVPPMPEITPEVAAILGKLERNETITVVEQLALAELRRWTGIAKAPSVVELVKSELEGSTGKIIVFAYHREVIRIIAASLGAAAASITGATPASERQRLIDRFQHDDSPRVLVIQILAGGTAITLHRASRVIFAEVTWVPADVVQAAKRCHRIGQTRSVLASVVSLAGSIDERVNRVVARKAAEMTALETMIREGNAA